MILGAKTSENNMDFKKSKLGCLDGCFERVHLCSLDLVWYSSRNFRWYYHVPSEKRVDRRMPRVFTKKTSQFKYH